MRREEIQIQELLFAVKRAHLRRASKLGSNVGQENHVVRFGAKFDVRLLLLLLQR